MNTSAPSATSSSTATTVGKPVKIIVDRNQASHIDATGNCYVNPQDCAVPYGPESAAYIFDIEFLQRLRRHIRKMGSFELDTATLSRDLENVATSLITVLDRNLTAGR